MIIQLKTKLQWLCLSQTKGKILPDIEKSINNFIRNPIHEVQSNSKSLCIKY